MSILSRFIIILFVFCYYKLSLSCDVESKDDKKSIISGKKRTRTDMVTQDSEMFKWSGNNSAFILYDNPSNKKTKTNAYDNKDRQENIESKVMNNPSVNQLLNLRNSNFSTLNIDADSVVFNDDNECFDHQAPIKITNPQHYDCIKAIENLNTNDDKLKTQRLILLFKCLEESSINNFHFDITHLNMSHFYIMFNYFGWQDIQRYKVKKLTLSGEVGEPQFESLKNILLGFNNLFQLDEITLSLNDLNWKELFDPVAEKIRYKFLDELCKYRIKKISLPHQNLNNDVIESLIMSVYYTFKINYYYLPSSIRTLNLCDNNISDLWKQRCPNEFNCLMEVVTNL